MHSTIFVMDSNPVSRYHDCFDDEELAAKMMYGRGYDYWCETDLEAEVKSCFSGSLAKCIKTDRIEVEEAGYPGDVIVQFKMMIINRDAYLKDLYRKNDWRVLMMNRFYDAWQFLAGHPVFVRIDDPIQEPSSWCFMRNLDIEVVKVNPSTNMISDKEAENTKAVVWLECGTNDDHDLDLDCGGDTFEEAIIELAELVRKKFGDYSDL